MQVLLHKDTRKVKQKDTRLDKGRGSQKNHGLVLLAEFAKNSAEKSM